MNTKNRFKSFSIKSLILFLLLCLIIIVPSCKKPSQGRDALKIGLAVARGNIKAYNSSFLDLKGEEHTLSEYKGKVIVLNLWATWCIHCNMEMPAFEEMSKHYKDKDFQFIAINTEMNQITTEEVKEYISKGEYSFFTGIDRYGEVSKNYGIGSLPVTYIIDKDFEIVGRVLGSTDWSSPVVYRIIDRLLKN